MNPKEVSGHAGVPGKEHVPPGSRILDVGGGNSHILKHFAKTHDCWNINKMEGVGNEPKQGAIYLYYD